MNAGNPVSVGNPMRGDSVHRIRTVRARASIWRVAAFTSTLSMVLGACTVPASVPPADFTFRATEVAADAQTGEYFYSQSCTYFLSNCYDEPYLVNIWFRVRYGVADSADAGVVSARSASPEVTVCTRAHQPPCPAGSDHEVLQAGAGRNGAQVSFSQVPRLNLVDLADPSKALEVVGVWTWALEEDWAGNPVPKVLAPLIEELLNETIAAGEVPEDPNQIPQDVIDEFSEAIELGGSALQAALEEFLLSVGDDLLGSRLYLFVGSSGGLATTIDLASVDASGISLGLQSIGIPDVAGVSIRSTQPATFTGERFEGAGAVNRYDLAAG